MQTLHLSAELLVMGIIPAVLGVAMPLISIRRLYERPHFGQVLLTLSILALSLLALWILYRIFIIGAYPTVVPHVALALALSLLVAQMRFARKNL